MPYRFSSQHTDCVAGNSSSPPSLPASPSLPSSSEGDPTLIEAFLTHWFHHALSDLHTPNLRIVLAKINRPKKDRMYFAQFQNISDAAQWAAQEGAHSNVYFHISLHGHCPRDKGTSESAGCLPGLFADLDAQSPFRGENEGKAPSVEALYSLVRDFEAHYPFHLLLIESGYGIYPSIRFREPLYLADQRTRNEAADLLSRFAEAFRIFGRAHGWPNTVDRVPLGGLARLPGTYNRKGPSPLTVRLVERNGDVG